MKIEGNNGKPDCTSIRLEPLATDRTKADSRAERAAVDRVDLSSDIEVVDSAMRLATAAPEIRQHLVERARQKLEAGQLGQDLSKLADLLIDDIVVRR